MSAVCFHMQYIRRVGHRANTPHDESLCDLMISSSEKEGHMIQWKAPEQPLSARARARPTRMTTGVKFHLYFVFEAEKKQHRKVVASSEKAAIVQLKAAFTLATLKPVS